MQKFFLLFSAALISAAQVEETVPIAPAIEEKPVNREKAPFKFEDIKLPNNLDQMINKFLKNIDLKAPASEKPRKETEVAANHEKVLEDEKAAEDDFDFDSFLKELFGKDFKFGDESVKRDL